jgi:hypothetical protein
MGISISWSISLFLFLAWAGTAQAEDCKSVTLSPDPLLIPAEGGLFEYTATTETNPYCLCDFTIKVDVFIPIPDRPGFPILRGERVENPGACIFDYPWNYAPNNGPQRIMNVYAHGFAAHPDYLPSQALDTIQVIQSGLGGGGSGGGNNSTLSAIFARDDFVVAYRDATLDYQVLRNDAATDGLDPASIQIKQQGASGVATPDGAGNIGFAPAQGFFGHDTFTYTVKDTQGKESNTATVDVTVKNEPPFTGCVFTRRNHHLHFHHPALYVEEVQQVFRNPPLEVTVQALGNGLPLEQGVPIRIESSKPIFPGPSGLPESVMASGQTAVGGAATFAINPPKPNPSDRIGLTATATIDGTEHACQSVLTVGLGSQLAPYLDALDGIAEGLSQQ